MPRKKESNGAATAEKPRRRSKQQTLPGVELPSIPAIDNVADDYREARDLRMTALEREVELGDKLKALMHEHHLTAYEYDGKIVELNTKEKVWVRRSKDAEDDGEE
jgi:hypothetical protein